MIRFGAGFGPDSAMSAFRLSPVPPHSPYQAGDWVQVHGYAGQPPGPRRSGFRGFVLGSLGATILRGLTDDGDEWAEYWGLLVPDGTPSADGRCSCCPRRPVRPRVEQLGLFQADLFGACS